MKNQSVRNVSQSVVLAVDSGLKVAFEFAAGMAAMVAGETPVPAMIAASYAHDRVALAVMTAASRKR